MGRDGKLDPVHARQGDHASALVHQPPRPPLGSQIRWLQNDDAPVYHGQQNDRPHLHARRGEDLGVRERAVGRVPRGRVDGIHGRRVPRVAPSQRRRWTRGPTRFDLARGVDGVFGHYLDQAREFIKDLTALTNVHTQEFSSDTCEVRSVTMVNHEEAIQSSPIGHAPVEIKFVNNKKYQSTLSGHSIGQFEDYLEAVHHKYLVLPDQDLIEEDRWHHWDHWLDSHVGIKFKNTTGCEDTAMKVNNYLLEGQIPTGKRAINHDGDHYYTGPSGISLSFEYNTECHVFVNKSTDICTCVHENSDKLAKELGLDDSYCDEDNKF